MVSTGTEYTCTGQGMVNIGKGYTKVGDCSTGTENTYTGQRTVNIGTGYTQVRDR
jgi:hypothetical protein